MNAGRFASVLARASCGFSLIMAMLMLVVIGLAAGAIMRNATTGDQVANNSRLRAQANRYAQFALRFCENQLGLAPASRSASILEFVSPPAWSAQGSWTATATDTAHTLSSADIGSTVQPRVAPQCLIEASGAADVYTITARGFSADFRADSATGATLAGSAVWLQATIRAGVVRQRVWQQLLTPPF